MPAVIFCLELLPATANPASALKILHNGVSCPNENIKGARYQDMGDNMITAHRLHFRF